MTSDALADFDHEIIQFLQSAGVESQLVQLSTPPEREYGERATNVAFLLAKERRIAPQQIAQEIAASFRRQEYRFLAKVEPAGKGFINFYLDYGAFIPHAIEGVRESGALYGRRPDAECKHMVVEHTSVNPNKEWHIGHVRNAVLGDIVARALRLAGNEVQVQNYIDDTGMQAAVAIVGLLDFPEQPRPGEKFDHYSGRSYVKISAELEDEGQLRKRLAAIEQLPREDQAQVAAEQTSIEARLANIDRLKRRVMQVMHQLEQGEYQPLIQRILDGQLETAYRLGVFYDLLTWESNLVETHLFDEAMQRLQESPRVHRPAEGRYAGALVIETDDPGQTEDEKAEVLIRSNGLPTYVAKDIAYHMWKFHVLPDRLCYVVYTNQPNAQPLWSTSLHGEKRGEEMPDGIINVIAVHQTQPQATVREALRVAGYPEAASRLRHLDYGMVSTAEGKLSGRKGTSVSGDTVISEAVRVALDRVKEKRSQDLDEQEMETIAEAVGVGAVRYFMVQYNPLRNIVFDVGDVVSYDGNTGLYIQYALVRMFAILRRARDDRGISEAEIDNADTGILTHEQEKRLVYHLALYPGTIADAARTLSANLIAEFAFDLATIFSQFYRDCTVLDAEPALRNARLLLVRTVRDVLVSACSVLGLPVVERL